MKTNFIRAIAAIGAAVLNLSSEGMAQSSFTLGFLGQTALQGTAGRTVTSTYFSTLAAEGPSAGAEGWSIAISADGAEITAITLAGTDIVASPFYEKTELTSGPGNAGAVSGVLLVGMAGNPLPPASTRRIAQVTLKAPVAEEDRLVVLRYVDGLRGSGQPIRNLVVEDAEPGIPVLRELEITVSSGPPNVRPSVTLKSPANGAIFAAPAEITLKADASDSDGSVKQVEFYSGDVLMGTDITAPYSFLWSGVPVGTYVVKAVAVDNRNGRSEASASIAVKEFGRIPFIRGDSNSDRLVDISDMISILSFLFLGGAPPACKKSADTNDDGAMDISDATFGLGTLYLGAGTIPEPNPACGDDLTPDKLECQPQETCGG